MQDISEKHSSKKLTQFSEFNSLQKNDAFFRKASSLLSSKPHKVQKNFVNESSAGDSAA